MIEIPIEDDDANEGTPQEPEYDWRNYGDYDQSTSTSLDGKDVVAIFIAALQTIFLPLVLLAAAMLVVGILLGIIF